MIALHCSYCGVRRLMDHCPLTEPFGALEMLELCNVSLLYALSLVYNLLLKIFNHNVPWLQTYYFRFPFSIIKENKIETYELSLKHLSTTYNMNYQTSYV